MNKLYHATISNCESVHCIGACAISKNHAAELIVSRFKQENYLPTEYKIDSIKFACSCEWEIGTTLIYN